MVVAKRYKKRKRERLRGLWCGREEQAEVKESKERQEECSAAVGRRAFMSSKNTSVCAAASGEERCSVELEVFVFVDLVPECMQTAHSTLHWEGEVRWPLRQAIK